MRNFDTYFERMNANLNEKLDFIIDLLENIECLTIFDYGCADGSITKALANLFPNKFFIGVDKPEIVDMNNKNNITRNILYTSYVEPELFKRSVVILSSILHEVYSFMEPYKFLDKFKYADYIVIQDMRFTPTNNDIIKHEKINEKMYNDFIKTRENFGKKEYAEFLLKQRYPDNYEEELKEKYFSVEWEKIISYMGAYGFNCKYEYIYMNRFLLNDIKEKTNMDISKFTYSTHCKMVLMK